MAQYLQASPVRAVVGAGKETGMSDIQSNTPPLSVAVQRGHRARIAPVLGRPLAALALISGAWALAPSVAAHKGDHPATATAPITLTFGGLKETYAQQQKVSGSVAIEAGVLKHARLRITVFDSDLCPTTATATTCPSVFDKDFKIEDDPKGRPRRAVDFELKDALGTSAYVVLAQLTVGPDSRTSTGGPDNGVENSGHERTTLAARQARIGVRQAALAKAPETVLKGDVATLNVAHLVSLLEHSSNAKEPTYLELGHGNRVKLIVERAEVVAPGVVIPGIRSLQTYRGRVVKPDGQADLDSMVELHVVDDTLSGLIVYGRDANRTDGVREQLNIDPMSAYDTSAGTQQHLVYRHRHTVLPPTLRDPANHPKPPTAAPTRMTEAPSWWRRGLFAPLPSSLGNLWAKWQKAPPVPFVSTAFAQQAATSESYTLRVSAYEHFYSNTRTTNRWGVLTRSLAQMFKEFQQDLAPIDGHGVVDSSRRLRMSNYLIVSWKQIPEAAYANVATTDDALNVFAQDPNARPTNPLGLKVLFTNIGNSGHPGVAYRGSIPRSAIYDFTTWSWTTYTTILMQELGHNLEAGYLDSTDAHLDPLLGERWGTWGTYSCTAMQATYGCEHDMQSIYARESNIVPRQRLISGVPSVSYRDPDWVPRMPATDPRLSDIAVGANGSVWAIGAVNADAFGNRRIYKYNAASARFEQNGNDANLRSAVRIAVDPLGVPYVATASGVLFKKGNASVNDIDYAVVPQPPEGASDVAVGVGGDLWVIGLRRSDGFGSIYRSTGSSWQQVVGAGNRIAVDSVGNPWVIGNNGQVFRRDGANFVLTPISGALDIGVGFDPNDVPAIVATAPGPAGNSYLYETDPVLWRMLPRRANAATDAGGGGIAVSVGRNGTVWMINNEGIAYSAVVPHPDQLR